MDTLVKILLLPFALLGSLWAHYFAAPVVVIDGDVAPVVIDTSTTTDDTTPMNLTLAVNESGSAHGLSLTPLSVEDSRCPRDVDCVWVGEVTARVAFEGPEGKAELDLTQRTPITVQGREVLLVGATPSRASAGEQIDQSEYRLTFTVSPANL